jgi:hypothetical protein
VRLGQKVLVRAIAPSLLLIVTRLVGGQDPQTKPVAVVGRANVYQDDDKTTVLTFLTEASGTVRDLTLRAGALADIQSSASVDVVTNATPGTEPRYTEPRLEFSGGAAYRLDLGAPVTMSAGYILSNEHDYRSDTLSVGSSIDLFQRTSTLAVGYSLGLNEIWRGGIRRFLEGGPSSGRPPTTTDPFFAPRDKTRQALDVSWTQVLGRQTLGTVSYSLAIETGFLSSPYRFVSTSDGAFRTGELHPDRRVRHAVGLRIRQYVFRDAALEATYRFYGDEWRVFSNTVGAAFVWHPLQWLDLDVHDRFYWQTDAAFYQPSYLRPEEIMTGDKELSRFWDNMVGARAGFLFGSFGPVDRLRIDAKFDWLRFEYSNFPRRPQLNAYVSQFGLMGEF